MPTFARLALAAGLAMAVAGTAPAQAGLQNITYDFTIAGSTVTGASANGTYTSPTNPFFCIGPNNNNCVSSGLFGAISFSDVSETVGKITFSFFGGTNSGAGAFTVTLGNFSGDVTVADITYESGSLFRGSFGLTNQDGTTATFTATTANNYVASGPVVFNVELAPVPEPASLALFGAALAGLGVARRRRAA